MTVIKQQKSLLFISECLPSKCYNELIRALNSRSRDSDRFEHAEINPIGHFLKHRGSFQAHRGSLRANKRTLIWTLGMIQALIPNATWVVCQYHECGGQCGEHFHDSVRPRDVDADSDFEDDREVGIRLRRLRIIVVDIEFYERKKKKAP